MTSWMIVLALSMQGTPPEPAGRPAEIQAISWLGDTLFPPPMPPEVKRDRELKRKEAYIAWEQSPDDVEAWIWLGRRTAYLGLYKDAIKLYGRAIERFPGDARLYRHRGHRYISVRELDEAIADLEEAVELIEGTDDRVEPDGLPNARNQPTSTLHGNVWYHLGLAYYLKGDFEEALRCYRECLKVSGNPDMLCATSHWLYMTLRRLGRDDEARAVLDPISPDMDIIENRAYHRLLLMYKGEQTPDELLKPEGDDGSLDDVTTGYGVGNWYLYNGDAERAHEIFAAVLESRQWPGFGYIAAEAEVARAKDD